MDNISIEKEQPNYYAIIPAAVRYDPTIPANAKLLYGEITALTNSKGYCWASNDYFAKLYNVNKKTISKWVQALITSGHIKAKMKFKNCTKQIEKRLIKTTTPIHPKVETPIHQKVETLPTEKWRPSPPNNGDPIHQKVEDNNTMNNTVNTTVNNKECASTSFVDESTKKNLPEKNLQKKPPTPATPKPEMEAYRRCVDFWLKDFHVGWTFGQVQGKSLKEFIKKIEKSISDTGVIPDADGVVNAFKALMHNLPEFYKMKDLQVLNGHYNTIISEIKNKKNGITKDLTGARGYDPSKSRFYRKPAIGE